MAQAGNRQTKAERDAARRAKVEEQRRLERVKAQRRRLFGWGGGVLALLVVAGIVVALAVHPRPAASSSIDPGKQIIPAAADASVATTTQQKPKKVKDTSGIQGVTAWDTTGWPGDGTAHAGAVEHQHVDGPVDYAITPPVGGPHNPIWMNAGVYTKPVPTERAVHNLEHGAVWITYRPSLSASDVKKLTAFVGKQSLIAEPASNVSGQSNRYVDLTPWADDSLPAPIVISAWGHQLQVSSPSDPRLQKFIDVFRHNKKYTPEYGAAVDGVPVQTGGVPAAYGSSKPNPAGTAQE